MSCNFIYTNGKLEVRADNGSPSLLFEKAKKVFGEEMAKEVFLVSKSDQFQDVFKSTVEVMQKRLLRKFDNLRVVEQLKPVSEKTFEIPKFTYNEDIGRIKGVDAKEEDGATFNLDGTTYQDGGLVVPLESFNTTQEDLTKEDIDNFIEEQKEKIGNTTVKVGIYKFPNSNRVSVDLNVVIPSEHREVALEFGKFAGQESLFNLDTFENDKTGADGKNPKTFTAEEFKIIAEKLSRGENPSEYLNNKNGRERTRWDESRGNQTLEGAPIIEGATGADAELTLIAEEYAKSKDIPYNRQPTYVEVDEKLAKRLADAYEDMKHDPQNPKVKEAYENLIRQTTEQYNFLVKNGYTFDFFDSETDPYEGNPWNAMRDLRNNKKISVYGTYDGYGAEGVTEGSVEDNPMLADTGLKWKDQNGKEHTVLANDLFRAVHDAFGHGLEGSGFRARGEENAWQSHVRLFTGSAVGAITSETRGQNSWLNYGKFGKQNQTAKIEDTVFAEQKVGLMPEWTWTEGVDKEKPLQGGAVFSKFFEKVTNTEKGGAKFNNVLDVLSKPVEGFEKELEAYLKYGMNFQKHIMASIPGFVDARIRVLKGMVEASKVIAKGGEINMLDITSSEGYYTKAYAQLAQDAGVDAKADALDAGVSFQRDFYKAPQVKGVNYLLQAWGDSFVDPASGQTIPSFKAKKKYGVVFEGMGFQFFTPTRNKEIKEVKSLMSPEGLFVTMEKLKNKDYDKREVAKDEFKSQFFTQDEIKEKQKSILKKEDSSVGMMDYQFDRKAYEKVLSDNFKYVVQIYSSGNFAGYYASDNLEVIQTALKNTGDTTTKFNEEVTPNIIKTDTDSILENNKLKSQSTGSKIIENKGAKLYFKDRVNPFNNKLTGEIELELVESSIKGRGNAKKAIADFLSYTDSIKKPVHLTVSPRDKNTTEKGLIKLYESFGFRLDSSGFEMTRKPKKVSLPIQDKNGEPVLEEVTKFMTSQNRSEETLTVDQQADMLNLMASKGIASVDILKAKVKKAFYNEYGIFELNFDKLVASGLYTRAEAKMLDERFEEVKQTVEALQNTDLNLTVDILEDTEVTFEYTSFGTLKRVPQQTEEVKNTEVLNSNLENIPDNNTLDKLIVAAKINDSSHLLLRLEKMLNRDDVVLNDDVQVTMEALSDIADAFIPLGVDIQRLEELASDEDLKPFIAILAEFARKPNEGVRKAFSEAYNEKFGISVQPKKVKTSEDKKYFVVDDSIMTEQEIFEQKDLVKHAPNLYYKVIRESVEVLLEKLNLTKERETLEREAMTQEGYNNAEIALEVLLYKKAFKSPTKVVKQENIKLDNFTGDFNYLTEDFLADFHIEMIKEQKKNSKKWNNFYSLFDFNDKGLFIKNEDSYFMSMIELYADENLRQYSLISRQMPNLVVEEQEANSLQKDRDVVVNNSNILPLYKGTSYSIDASNVILKGATSKFIKLQDGIYEAVQNNGDLTLYSKLEIAKEEYYQVGVKQPTPNIDINDYNNLKNTPENFVKNSNLKSKEEKDKIKRNNFDCL